MTRILLLTLLLLLGGNAVLAQTKNSDDCQLAIAKLKSGKVIKSYEFKTVVYEEELTSKVFRIPHTGLLITASVFYTDESMASKHGADSMRLGLAVSPKAWKSAFEAPNNAVAEVTYTTFDTAQVFTSIYVKRRRLLIIMECQEGFRVSD